MNWNEPGIEEMFPKDDPEKSPEMEQGIVPEWAKYDAKIGPKASGSLGQHLISSCWTIPLSPDPLELDRLEQGIILFRKSSCSTLTPGPIIN